MSTRHPHYTGWPMVEGYCGAQSYEPGQRIEVHCSGRAPSLTATVTLVRADRTVMWSQSGIAVADHGVVDGAWAVGCDWPVGFFIDTDHGWPSGFYEVRLEAEVDSHPDTDPHPDPGLATAPESDRRRLVSEAFFVLRPGPRGPRHPGLLVLSTNTYNAYNQWGGRCLYSGATQLSFARPIERGYLRRPAAPFDVDFDGRVTNVAEPSDPEHQKLQDYQAANSYPLWTASSGWHNWERRFVRWACTAGFEFDVAINSDLEFHPEVLDGHRLMLTIGHDEYWSWDMRDTMDRWVADGGNWAIMSGNTAFWQVRYADEGRTMVCHKGTARRTDPVVGTERSRRLTTMWSDPLVARPEAETIGLSFTRGGYHRIGQAVPHGSGAYTVHRPDHWAFDGTGLRYGDQLGTGSFVVGYEVDGCAYTTIDGLPVPTNEDGTPSDLEILATSPARLLSITEDRCEAPEALWASVEPPGDLEGVSMVLFGDASEANVARLAHGSAVIGSFTRGRGTVFNAGSADWAYGLDRDPTVQQVTANVIRHLGGTDEVGAS